MQRASSVSNRPEDIILRHGLLFCRVAQDGEIAIQSIVIQSTALSRLLGLLPRLGGQVV